MPMLRNPSASPHPFTFSKIFSGTTWPIKTKNYVMPPWVGETKVCSRHLGHMTKMAAMPLYGKNSSKPKLQLTWYVASGTPVHHGLFK